MRKQVVLYGMLAVSIPLGLGTGCDLVQGLKPATLVETGGGGQGGAGGSTITGGTGGTTSMFCEPGTSIPCYTGPEGTEGVAMCKGGMRACKADGSGHEDTCEGEVLPKAETCASTGDEDCDQLDCVRWASVFGDELAQEPRGVAVDKEGNAYVVGTFAGALPFGDPPLVSAGQHDFFLVKLSPLGVVLWSKRFGDGADQDSIRVAIDPSGNVVLGGTLVGTINLGGQNLVAQGFDVFVAKLDPSGGHLWSHRFGDAAIQNVVTVQSDGDGNVLLAGSFRGDLDFGKGLMTASCCNFDLYVAKLDKDGVTQWSKSFGDADDQGLNAGAVDSSGSLTIFGDFSGNVDFGGGDLVAVGNKSGFGARFDSLGSHVWSKRYSNESLSPRVSASDESGNLILFGNLAGSVDFDGKSITSDGEGTDLFLMNASSIGFAAWAKLIPTVGSSNFASGAIFDGDGNLVITAWGSGTVDLGGGVLGTLNKGSVFLAKLEPGGQHLWSRRFDGSASVVATAPNGDIVLAAKVSGTVDVGTGPLVTKGQDLLIARFAP